MAVTTKKQNRIRRARKMRAKARELGITRLVVFKSQRHLYAQIIQHENKGDRVLAAVSSGQEKNTNANMTVATVLGKKIAKLALAKGVERVAFDRGGFRYHGRIKALADAARAQGLQL